MDRYQVPIHQENKAQYKPGSEKQVKQIYSSIEKLENNYDAALMGDTKQNAPALMKELNALKGSLDKFRIKSNASNGNFLKISQTLCVVKKSYISFVNIKRNSNLNALYFR